MRSAVLAFALVTFTTAFIVELNVTTPCNFTFCGAQFEAAVNISWGGGCLSNTTSCLLTAGPYSITAQGSFYGLDFGACNDTCSQASVVAITSWAGLIADNRSTGVFQGCSNLIRVSALDQPIFPPEASLTRFFANCTRVKFFGNLSWDVGNLISADYMFAGAENFNSNVLFTNASSLRSTAFMFQNARSFNSEVSFNATGVTSMEGMFQGSGYNQNLVLDTSSCTNFASMFESCAIVTPVSLNTASATTFKRMFAQSTFNSPIDFDASNVLSVEGMFQNNLNFNSNVTLRNSTLLDSAAFMFQNTRSFNGFLSASFDSVTTMEGMFAGTGTFDRDVVWDTPRLINTKSMFQGASSFNRPVSLSNCSSLFVSHMFDFATNFNGLLTLCGGIMDPMFMFFHATAFNSPINFTTVSGSAESMFAYAGAFNQPVVFLASGELQSTKNMFEGAIGFGRQDVSFDTVAVADMSGMFRGNSMRYEKDKVQY